MSEFSPSEHREDSSVTDFYTGRLGQIGLDSAVDRVIPNEQLWWNAEDHSNPKALNAFKPSDHEVKEVFYSEDPYGSIDDTRF